MHVQHGLAGFFAQRITRLKSMLAKLSSRLWGKSTSKFILVGDIQLFVVVRLRSLFPCRLPARGYLYFQEALYTLYHMAPSILKPAVVCQILLMPEISIFLCLSSLEQDLKIYVITLGLPIQSSCFKVNYVI